jgi:hypothetical protein
MEKYGCTGTACIPMTLDDAIELGKIKRGDLVVMISSGLGWNQVAAAVRICERRGPQRAPRREVYGCLVPPVDTRLGAGP